jgi:nitroreductase
MANATATLTANALSIADAIYGRRSVRAYRETPMTADQIRVLLDAAVHAPTAMHAEPWCFTVIQDRQILRHISDVAKQQIAQVGHQDLHNPGARSAFLDAVARPDFNIFYDAGTLILIGAHAANPFAAADCWLAAQNLMLAAPALGLGTCCIGSALAALNSVALKHELDLPVDVTIVAAITVGVPAESPAPTTRKPPFITRWIGTPAS